MLSRILDRLTYANVVATLALFVALGGSAYAVGEISSRDVKNRSLKGGDLRLNTVTGKEVNESKLSTVPLARQAENAGTADISKSAGTATTAGTADLANLARDAQTLAGQGVGAFENSSVVAFGKAPVNPASSSAEQVVLSWPELGVAVTTRDQGPCGGDLGVSFRNTRSSGASIQIFENDNSGADPLAAPGGEADVCTSSDNADSFRATVTDTSGRALFVDCVEGNDELRCLGIRSE